MEPGWIVTGGVGFMLSLCFSSRIDGWQQKAVSLVKRRIQERTGQRDSLVPELPVISRLTSSLRAGTSLDAALEGILGDESFPLNCRSRIELVMQQQPERDFFSQFLASALQSGAPILAPLTSLQRILLAEKKMKLRAESVSGQSRAQAEVLTWLPWGLAAGIAVIDPEWISTALGKSESWIAWSFALALCGCGRIWIKSLVARSLRPGSREEEALESHFPDLVLRFSTQLSLGRDPRSCLEAALAKDVPDPLRAWVSGGVSAPGIVTNFRSLVKFAEETGAPLRDELANLQFELHASQEARWEARLQRLPVALLAPLFCCFFPACLLILIGMILPLWKDLA